MFPFDEFLVNPLASWRLPIFKTRIEEAAGVAVPLEIHWDRLCPEGESHLFAECWSAVYFEPLIAALKIVGRDAIGREALGPGLKKVIVRNTKANYYADNFARSKTVPSRLITNR